MPKKKHAQQEPQLETVLASELRAGDQLLFRADQVLSPYAGHPGLTLRGDIPSPLPGQLVIRVIRP